MTRLVSSDAVTWNGWWITTTLRSIRLASTTTNCRMAHPVSFPHTGYDITVASELMAILALRPASGSAPAVGRAVIGLNKAGKRCRWRPGRGRGGVCSRTRSCQPDADARRPAHLRPAGRSRTSRTATAASGSRSPKLGDYVVTESRFGADIGVENASIRCRYSGLVPDAVVLVAPSAPGTAVVESDAWRAPGQPTPANLELLGAGAKPGAPHRIARNSVSGGRGYQRFSSDTEAESNWSAHRGRAGAGR